MPRSASQPRGDDPDDVLVADRFEIGFTLRTLGGMQLAACER